MTRCCLRKYVSNQHSFRGRNMNTLKVCNMQQFSRIFCLYYLITVVITVGKLFHLPLE